VAVDAAGSMSGPFGLAVPRCPKVSKAKKAHHSH
jgi:hypothetical protein